MRDLRNWAKLAKRRAQLAILAAALGFASWSVWGGGSVASAQDSAGTGRALAVVAKDVESCGALLVGVDQYASKSVSPLHYACSDVRKIGDALIEIDFPAKNIRTLVGDGPVGDRPTRAVSLDALDELLAKSGPNSTVLVVFSGHGFETPDGRSAFCPEDVAVELAADGRPTVKAESAILLDEVAKRLRQDDARFKLLIVDACRESASVSRDALATPRSFSSVDASGLAFLQSCGSSEFSWEHPELGGGVFSAFFTEGLRGAADSNGDGGVTFWEVCERASHETQRFTKRECATVQTPFYTFSGVSDFYLTPPRPGRGGSGTPPSGSGWLPFALFALTGGAVCFAVWAELKRRRTAETSAPSGASVATPEAELARQILGEAEVAKLRREREAAQAAAKATSEEIKAQEAASQTEGAEKIQENALTTAKVGAQASEKEKGKLSTNVSNVEPKAGTRKTILVNGDEFAFRYCPSGTFWTGSAAGEIGRRSDETRRKATLTRGFWTLETPVTQAMFKAITGENPSYFSPTGRGCGNVDGLATANFPVENVSWNDCVAFVKSLNDGGYLQDGFEFRLPTETEWEYAARAGTETPFPWGEALNGEQANCNGTLPYGTNAKGPYWRRTTAVRSYPPNAWGLCDVVGNVWEWAANEGETFENGDEKKAPTGYKRVLRGGSWLNYPQNCRVASRKWEFAATVQDYGNGFRIIVARRDAEAERLRCEREAAERAEAERRAKEAERAEAERRAQEAERRAREEVERRAQEAERRAREAERRAQEAERRAWEVKRRAREEAERRAREEAERRAREAKADYLLGRELAFGLNGTKVDGRRGFELLKKAADAGSVDAKAELAELYLDGCEGTPSDAARAFAAVFEAAQSDNPFALYVLGRRYDEGRRVSKDEKLAAERKARAFREFEKRAKSGDVRAKTRLGVMLLYGIGCSEDEDAGFESIREAAETGSAEAMYWLAEYYASYSEGEEDETRAFEWYRKAANAGNAAAWRSLAGYYMYGIGVAKDKTLAIACYCAAADAGDADAMMELAECYRFGKGGAEDEAKMVAWYRKAADAGRFDAMRKLGDCCKNGIGTRKDAARAFEWYREAAEAGDALAMCELGDCYRDGVGTLKDGSRMVEWYRKAADVKYALAMYLLGKCYEKGIGVGKNVAEAKKWYRKAAEQERYRLWKTEAEEALRRLESEAEAGGAKPTLFDAAPLFAASDSASGVCEAEPAAGARKTLRVRDVEFAFRYCPSGTFWMGSPASEIGRKDDETRHKVTLTRGFWLLETPVTQRMFEAITGKNPSWFSLNGGGWEKILELDDRDTSEFPVERVGRRACQDFLYRLNKICEAEPDCGLKSDWEFRLPTEAEWEYAARAGTSTAFYWGDRFETRRVNCVANASYGVVKWERTTPVGYYPPNAWGLFDMLGNVYEWCGEYYDAYPSGATTDPTGPWLGAKGVLRGGRWNSDENFAGSRRAAPPRRNDGVIVAVFVLASIDVNVGRSGGRLTTVGNGDRRGKRWSVGGRTASDGESVGGRTGTSAATRGKLRRAS